jgi:hypothetical protein
VGRFGISLAGRWDRGRVSRTFCIWFLTMLHKIVVGYLAIPFVRVRQWKENLEF